MSILQQQENIHCQEGRITICDLPYAYKLWQNKKWQQQKTTAVLALHGWLDNANSFDVLAPQLLAHLPLTIVALDMAGHGLSGHRHIQGHYNIWDDLAELALLTEQLAWDKFVLLGHSRGAMISSLFATSCLKKLHAMILLDGLLPVAIDEKDAPLQLQKFVKQKIRNSSLQPSYESKQQAIAARCKAANMQEQAASIIVERALLINAEQRFVWRSDPRLNHPSAFKLSKQQNDAFFKRIAVPTLLLLAAQGLAEHMNLSVSSLDSNPLVQHAVLQGAHHFHMEKKSSAEIAQRIANFLKSALEF